MTPYRISLEKKLAAANAKPTDSGENGEVLKKKEKKKARGKTKDVWILMNT